MNVLKKLRDNMATELSQVGTEIATVQKTLENLSRRQEQLKGAVYALDLALSETEKPSTTAPEVQAVDSEESV